jgi:hypothetical protein
MPARVIIHPRCLNGPAAGALEAVLQAKGFQPGELAIGPANAKGHCDLVRLIDNQNGVLTLERMDGHRFQHRGRNVELDPAPEVA